MDRLTPEERRRVSLARQEANRRTLARMSAPIASTPPPAPRHRLHRIVETAMTVALLGGGWFAYRAVEFHVPTSIVEALLPRL
jgi:hypothetical protein